MLREAKICKAPRTMGAKRHVIIGSSNPLLLPIFAGETPALPSLSKSSDWLERGAPAPQKMPESLDISQRTIGSALQAAELFESADGPPALWLALYASGYHFLAGCLRRKFQLH